VSLFIAWIAAAALLAIAAYCAAAGLHHILGGAE
jgi:hypothetical protein